MNIYRIEEDVDTYDAVVFLRDEDAAICAMFDGQTLSGHWKPLPVAIYPVEKTGDFFYFASGAPAMSEKSWRLLLPVIEGDAEALPLICTGYNIVAMNVTSVVDCLDRAGSKINWLPSGNAGTIDLYRFRADCVGDRALFKISEHRRSEVFATDRFKAAVEAAGLTGLNFRQVA